MLTCTKQLMSICVFLSRSKDIVEPLLKPQWYVDCREMGKQAADVVRNGELKIIPDHHLKTWFNWMDNIRWPFYFSSDVVCWSHCVCVVTLFGYQGLVHLTAVVVGPQDTSVLCDCEWSVSQTRRGEQRHSKMQPAVCVLDSQRWWELRCCCMHLGYGRTLLGQR